MIALYYSFNVLDDLLRQLAESSPDLSYEFYFVGVYSGTTSSS
jgi:hypothetical protein